MNFTDSEKAAITTKYKRGIPIQELSAEYGISERTIYRWAKHYPTVGDEQFLSPKEYKLCLHNYRFVLKKSNFIQNLNKEQYTPKEPFV